MIDLHLHSTASDGVLSPSALVEAAAAARLKTISLTDHDTVAGIAEADATARRLGLTLIPGIEITAVEAGRDIHMLGYGLDPGDAALLSFLRAQRVDRVRRVSVMADRLAGLGAAIDVRPLIAQAEGAGRSVGRPHVAEALVAAGHVRTLNEAFDRYLAVGRPAFVPRTGASPADVLRIVAAAGGICSLAHPGLTRIDERIPALAQAGLAALEARHSDHDPETERKYRTLAASLGLAISGGSDFHGEGRNHRARLGEVTLTAADYAGLAGRLSPQEVRGRDTLLITHRER